jgi:hypothetical protein
MSRKLAMEGPAPPLPGQESNVKDMPGYVEESDINGGAEEFEDGEDRGRLFVKVVGVKDLKLPLPCSMSKI